MITNKHLEIAQLVEKLAMEMVFTQPDKDDGLLPINSLLGEVENLLPAHPVPGPIAEAIGMARQWVDAALEAGAFSETGLARLSAWNPWMQSALHASDEQHLPPIFTMGQAPERAAPSVTVPPPPPPPRMAGLKKRSR
jgi:hypothetical protein